MPYKDKIKQREYNKKRMQEARRGSTRGNTKQENVLPDRLKPVLPEGHPILSWLIDPIKRDRLQRITTSLERHHALNDVLFGIPRGVWFGTIKEILKITRLT